MEHDHASPLCEKIDPNLPHVIVTAEPAVTLADLKLLDLVRVQNSFSSRQEYSQLIAVLTATYTDTSKKAVPYWPALDAGESRTTDVVWSWTQHEPPLRVRIARDGCVQIDAAIGDTRNGMELFHLDTVGALVREVIDIAQLVCGDPGTALWSLRLQVKGMQGRLGTSREPSRTRPRLSRNPYPTGESDYDRSTTTTTQEFREAAGTLTRAVLQDLFAILGVADGPFIAPMAI